MASRIHSLSVSPGLRYIASRLGWALVTLWGLATIVFILVRSLPGDPAITLLGEFATEESLARTREMLGLGQPLFAQYIDYLSDLAMGNLGTSFRSGTPVINDLQAVIMPTIILAGVATVFAVLVGISAGLIAAKVRGSALDFWLLLFAIAAISLPTFWIGLVLIYSFANLLPIFPSTGAGKAGNLFSQARALALPSIALGSGGAAFVARITRSSALEVLGEDYVSVGRAMGIGEWRLTVQYALRNAMPAISGAISVVFALSVANAVVIEAVFSRRGLGSLVLNATLTRDYPLIQSGLLTMAAIIVIANLFTDFAQPLIDPRIRTL